MNVSDMLADIHLRILLITGQEFSSSNKGLEFSKPWLNPPLQKNPEEEIATHSYSPWNMLKGSTVQKWSKSISVITVFSDYFYSRFYCMRYYHFRRDHKSNWKKLKHSTIAHQIYNLVRKTTTKTWAFSWHF